MLWLYVEQKSQMQNTNAGGRVQRFIAQLRSESENMLNKGIKEAAVEQRLRQQSGQAGQAG